MTVKAYNFIGITQFRVSEKGNFMNIVSHGYVTKASSDWHGLNYLHFLQHVPTKKLDYV